MDRKRLILLAVWLVALCILAYVILIPPGVAGSNCCLLPTQEQESVVDAGTGNTATVAAFQMSLSDPQNTDFANNGGTTSGRVGEYTFDPDAADDGCYDWAASHGHKPTQWGAQVRVTTPEPTYWWEVGQVGTCANNGVTCNAGALNTVNPTSAYNGFGYDGVGYWTGTKGNIVYPVTYYRGLSGIPLPCGYEYYQGMANYCIATKYWKSYINGGFNDLTGKIYSTYVVDCKNSVCATINQ